MILRPVSRIISVMSVELMLIFNPKEITPDATPMDSQLGMDGTRSVIGISLSVLRSDFFVGWLYRLRVWGHPISKRWWMFSLGRLPENSRS